MLLAWSTLIPWHVHSTRAEICTTNHWEVARALTAWQCRTSNVVELQFFDNIRGPKNIHHFSCRTLRKSPVTTSNKRQHSPIGSWLYPILTPQPIISQWAFHSVKELCTISTQLSWPSIARYGFHKGDFLYRLNSWKTSFKNCHWGIWSSWSFGNFQHLPIQQVFFSWSLISDYI